MIQELSETPDGKGFLCRWATSPLVQETLAGMLGVYGYTFIVDVRRQATDEDLQNAAYFLHRKREELGIADDPSLMDHDSQMAASMLSLGVIQAFAIGEMRGDIATIRLCMLVNATKQAWRNMAAALKEAKRQLAARRLEVLIPPQDLVEALLAVGFMKEMNGDVYVF
jgi:hypothetical protein